MKKGIILVTTLLLLIGCKEQTKRTSTHITTGNKEITLEEIETTYACIVVNKEMALDEFEQLLDALDSPASASAAAPSSASDEISEDEFDKLLDDLHGKAGPSGSSTEQTPEPSSADSGDEISDD